ncbi:unnamed protein product [Clavelina lepadiformis]|uniref:Uncharacterized protein n=2 Tax=Clavelina lepadiformis TaxID=159417 RepID=A0ABP0G4K7_CLALP
MKPSILVFVYFLMFARAEMTTLCQRFESSESAQDISGSNSECTGQTIFIHGEPGIHGEDGIPGDKGATGERGQVGPQGDNGEPGIVDEDLLRREISSALKDLKLSSCLNNLYYNGSCVNLSIFNDERSEMSVESYCLDVGGEMTEISNQAMVDNITDYYSSLLGNSVESWVKLEDKPGTPAALVPRQKMKIWGDLGNRIYPQEIYSSGDYVVITNFIAGKNANAVLCSFAPAQFFIN